MPRNDHGAAVRPRGLALITVLWVLTLLSLIAASFSSSTRTEIKLAFNQAEAARAEALADAGVHAAIQGLLATNPAAQWRADGTVYGWRFGEGEIRVGVWDEGGKIDLNAAPDALLQALFVAAGQGAEEASTLVDRIVDFRDPNDLRQLNGAEDRQYSDAGLPYGAKDAPFEALEELRQVLGMTPTLYDAVAPALTVHARQRQPHEPTAPPLVKAALAGETLDEEAPDEEAPDEEAPDEEASDEETPDEETPDSETPAAGPDDGSIAAEDGAADTEPQEPPVAGAAASEDNPGIVARSRINTFTIHAEARMDSGAVYAREAVVELGPGDRLPYEFWAWRQGRRSLFPLVAAAP